MVMIPTSMTTSTLCITKLSSLAAVRVCSLAAAAEQYITTLIRLQAIVVEKPIVVILLWVYYALALPVVVKAEGTYSTVGYCTVLIFLVLVGTALY